MGKVAQATKEEERKTLKKSDPPRRDEIPHEGKRLKEEIRRTEIQNLKNLIKSSDMKGKETRPPPGKKKTENRYGYE